MLAQESSDAAGGGGSWWDTIQRGGLIGYIIIGLSVVALALIIMHLWQIRRRALVPPLQIQSIDELLARGDLPGAVQYCLNPDNDSYLTRILASGLTRYQKSAFGAFEIKSAIEEAGEEQTARLYRSTDALGVIGHIAPLLGLLGTVVGMVRAFEVLPQSGATNAQELSTNISYALVTTLMGLVLAIPCIALFTFFRNRIDSFASEGAIEIERLVLHLESIGAPAGAAAAVSVPPRPKPAVKGPAPRPAAGGSPAPGSSGPSAAPGPPGPPGPPGSPGKGAAS